MLGPIHFPQCFGVANRKLTMRVRRKIQVSAVKKQEHPGESFTTKGHPLKAILKANVAP
jgi:hypothetical protein